MTKPKPIKVSQLPEDAPGSGWYEILSSPEPARPVSGEITADWAVIGAGFTGLAAARRLAELAPEASIVLIDAQRVGFGSAGRNSGFMIDLPHDLNTEDYTGSQEEDKKLIRLNRAAIAYARDMVQTHRIDCDWREEGKIHAAIEPAGTASLESFQHGLDGLGETYTPLDAAALKSFTGTDCYRIGVHTPGTVLIQPAAFVRGAAQTMPENVTVYENSPVTAVQGSGSFYLDCPQGKIKVAKLMLTNNGYAEAFGFLPGRLIHVSTYGSMTRPLDVAEQEALGGKTNWALIPAHPMGTTVRRLSNHRIVIRNTFTYNANYRHTAATRASMRQQHERAFHARFPMLPKVEFDYTWGGVLCLSRNATPYFGEISPGIFAAVCQNGLGVARGTIAGKLLAEYALGEDNDLVRDILSYPQPCRNPPPPLLGLGVSATIAWKEWRAGRER